MIAALYVEAAAARTPEAFRHELVAMARSVRRAGAALRTLPGDR